MASTTPNIGLTLPTGAEKVSRQIINDNNTIIDSKMGAVPGGQNLQGEIDELNGKLISYDVAGWTPSFPRDTVTNLYASWQRIGNILFITAQWTNVHGSGASYINYESLPTPPGYVRGYGFHGTWRSNTTDVAGEIGQFSEGDNMRFSKGGVGVELPNEPISFNAICFLRQA